MKPEILSKYPVLEPFVGEHYIHPDHKKVLIIGESHYLPKEEKLKSEPNLWYESDLDSNPIDNINWITTANVVKEFIEGEKLKKGHTFFNRLAHSLNVVFNDYYKNHKEILKHIAFLNFFPRPAKTGKSLNIEKRDIKHGINVLKWFIKKNEPDVIIVASKKAGKVIKRNIEAPTNFQVVAHPASQWWYRRAKSYGNRSGKELFEDFLNEQEVFDHK